MEKIKCSEKVTNDEIPEHIGEKRILLYNILRIKVKCTDQILRRNSLLHDAIQRQKTEVKGVGRTQFLDDLRNRRRYWEAKEEVEERKRWKWTFSTRTYGRNTSYLP
jgi:hypothetical protein